MASLRALAETYLAVETNPDYIKTIREALDNPAALQQYFGTRPVFGTAGIRGAMGPGYANLNPGIIIQTAQGYCSYALRTLGQEYVQSKGIVIGYDARNNSREYAEVTASVFILRGVKVYLFGMIIPTPYVAFAVCFLGAAGGVMVTASHNPASDNGYKVYWDNGAQIIEPHDKGIAAAIQENLLPWEGLSIGLWTNSPLCIDPTEEVRVAYENLIFSRRCYYPDDNAKGSSLRITYTAMHGVGHKPTLWLYKKFRLPAFIPVPNQVEGNGAFPTCYFPNPEEGEPVFREAFKVADAHGSSLILCQDPDADRIGVAVKKNGTWTILHGNHTGTLLTWWFIKHYKGDPKKALLECSTVSTRIQGVIAQKEGFEYLETLTGFKWLGNAALDFEAKSGEALFAFEESIGFGLLPGSIPDKDAVGTAACLGEMAHWLARVEGKDLLDKLEDVYAQYGYYLFDNSYFMCREPRIFTELFARMRTGGPGGQYIGTIGEFKVVRIRDMTTGFDTGTPDNKTVLPKQSSQMITFYLDNECTVTIRASGTEPKIKWYIEIGANDKVKAIHDLNEVIKAVQDDLLQREKYGLKHTE
jgi:phosphomannomutase